MPRMCLHIIQIRRVQQHYAALACQNEAVRLVSSNPIIARFSIRIPVCFIPADPKAEPVNYRVEVPMMGEMRGVWCVTFDVAL